MQIFQTYDIPEKFPNPVLTIGNYDGIHLGHRTIIERVKEHAKALSGTSMLMTFHPHPLRVLRPETELPCIALMAEKKRLIEETGIDVLIVVPFTKAFSLIPAETFVGELLVERLGIKGIVIGYDFKFGAGGKGDITLLREFSSRYGYFVEVVGAITIDNEKVGSNKIRMLIREGNVEKAHHFLGRPFALHGHVVRGHGRGKGLGYPTINLTTRYNLIPKDGVYITEVKHGGRTYRGVTNIGVNPTFGDNQQTVETFILDFDLELYGDDVALSFLRRIREEKKFSGQEELKKQIDRDVAMARQYFEEEGR